MGSPLGPVLANIFMCHLEETLFAQCSPTFRPAYYRRYVDDTFILFRTKVAAEQFLEFANSLHPNIQFTIEHETNNCLSFLDVLITRSEQHFSTSVYRKKTYTGLGSNFYSSCFHNFKTNSIHTLLRSLFLCPLIGSHFTLKSNFLGNTFVITAFHHFYLTSILRNI